MFTIFIFYFIHSFFFFFLFIFYYFLFFILFFLHFMYEKEVTFSGNPSNQKFLREKRKSSLKFKAKNWDFGRKEWNNYHWKFFSFASRSYWPISEGKKKSNQGIVLQKKKRETWRKERQLEREIYGKRRDWVSDSEGVRREK